MTIRLRKGGQLRLLDSDQIYEIRMAALEILERVGVKIESGMILDIFSNGGAEVDLKSKTAFLPQHLVLESISQVPKKVYLCGRNKKNDLVIEGDRVCFGLGGSPKSKILDIDTGEHRDPTLKDVEETTRLGDALPEIHFIQNLCQAMDKPHKVQYLYVAKAMMENSEKHALCAAADGADAKVIIDMASAVEKDLRKRPIASIYSCPPSPLLLSASQENIVEAAKHGVPTIVMTGPLAGANAPVTLAGAVAQSMAENFAALTLAQLVKRGVPIIMGGFTSIMDPRTTMACIGPPEFVIQEIMCKQVSRYYDLPYFGGGGTSDSKLPDAQAGAEAMMTAVTSALAGINMIQDVSILAFDNLGSPEMAVICDEIVAYVERILESSAIDAETLAVDVIGEVGPAGNFLSHKHTRQHIRQEIYIPRLFDRTPEGSWRKRGGRDIRTIARDRAKKIMSEHHPERLPSETMVRMDAILKRAELERTIVTS